MKKQNTRRSLMLSALALIMCVSMLIGSTFAWFTDSVTSANNIIKSGNLDIELEYWDGDSWEDVAGKSDILTNTLWEPGVTEVAYLRIANAGSLALKYQLGVNIKTEKPGVNAAGETFKLSDYIQFGVKEGIGTTGEDKKPTTYATREDAIAAVEAIEEGQLGAVKEISAGYTKASELYPANNIPVGAASELYLALVVYMPETVGNVANHNGTNVPEIELGINLVATQYTAELDSFDENYDKDAEYPVLSTVTKTENNPANVGADNVKIDIPADAPVGDYAIEIANKNVATNAAGETTVSYDISLTKDGVKISTPEGGIKYAINIEVGKNLDVQAVTHKGVAVDYFSYDPVTGIVTFETASFSPFAVVYKEADAKTVFTPATPEAAGKLEQAGVVAVDENGNGYTSITTAVKSGAAKLYLKEGADLGTVTHLDVANDLVIYGNGAYISGGERDLAIDTYAKLTKDITVTVYNLHGVAFWGQRNTEYTANLNLYNCNNIGRVYINGTSGVNNVALYNCTASVGNAEAYKNLVGDTVLYSNANGKLVIDGCTFTEVGCPVNLNHKVAGEQTVIVTNSTFVDCSTEGTAAYYAPIRLYNSAEGANQTLTVEGNTFSYSSGKAPINNADVLLNAKHNGADAIGTIKATVQASANVVRGANVATAYTIANAADLKAFADSVNKYSNYEYPYQGETVLLTNDVDLGGAEWTPIGDYRFSANRFCGTFDGQGHTISNFQITKKTDKNDSGKSSYGLFGNVEGTVKNLTVANATVSAYAYCGALIGRLNTGLVENCHVVNCTVTPSYWQGGIMIGQVNGGSVKNCTVSDSSISGKSALGGMFGPVTAENGDVLFENCTVKDSVVAQAGSFGGSYDKYFGGMFGYLEAAGDKKIDVNNCTAINTTVKGAQSAILSGDNDGNIYFNGVKLITTANELTTAIANAKAGDTIILGADVTASSVIMIDKSITINGNGCKVSSTATRVFRITAGNVEVTLNDVNMVSTAVRVGTNDVRGISIDILDGVKLTLNNCSVDFTDASANDWAYAVNVTGGTGNSVTVIGGTYEGANVINVRGAQQTVVVKDATLNCTYPNNDMYDGACIWVMEKQGSSVEATGNTFNGSNAVAFNIGSGTALNESNNTDNTVSQIR